MIRVCIFSTAFCLTVGHTDCNECESRETCGVIATATNTPICNCYSDCYEYGDCCTDVSHVENCVGMYHCVILELYVAILN